MKPTHGILFATLLLLAACSNEEGAQLSKLPPAKKPVSQTPLPPSQPPIQREQDFAKVMRGARLFKKACAACHGSQAEGAPAWSKRGADGKFPPPPLNGAGHGWHHPTNNLKGIISKGTIQIGGSMPGWGANLSNDDIESIIAWLQSRWPDQIFEVWARTELRARQAQSRR